MRSEQKKNFHQKPDGNQKRLYFRNQNQRVNYYLIIARYGKSPQLLLTYICESDTYYYSWYIMQCLMIPVGSLCRVYIQITYHK